jgi:hypothetical protein
MTKYQFTIDYLMKRAGTTTGHLNVSKSIEEAEEAWNRLEEIREEQEEEEEDTA